MSQQQSASAVDDDSVLQVARGEGPDPSRGAEDGDLARLAEAWDAAMHVEAYVATLWRKHRSRFVRNRDRTVVDDTPPAALTAQPLHILVLTEPWCEDSAQLVPMLWRLATERPTIEVRVLREHLHRDISSRYLNAAGHPAIPTFILLDEGGRQIGALVERPLRVTQEMVAELRDFQRQHADLPGVNRSLDRMPEETREAVKQHLAEWREGQHERWAGILFEELADIAAESGTFAHQSGSGGSS